jgi:hypothetical protein
MQFSVNLEDGAAKYVKLITYGPYARLLWPQNCRLWYPNKNTIMLKSSHDIIPKVPP